MDTGSLPIFEALSRKMNYLSARQAVIAQNIANADTPKYGAQDIKAPDFSDLMGGPATKVTLAVTNPHHISMNGSDKAGLKGMKADGYEMNMTENTVNVTEEVQKVSQIQMEYQMATSLYRKTTEMFRVALGRGGSA